ncbi:MAG TPA: class I SAM-dependent methyltransferase [Candidatus Udaeobacter sp.]|jgi:SAM-dependent methyltransferase
MSTSQLNYTGLDILESLGHAANYNALLLDLILQNTDRLSRMLDFGAGIGTFSKPLRDRGADVTCLEPDPYLADGLARAGFPVFGDLEQVPDSSFEFIFALNVLEHIEDDQKTVCHLGKKLAKGGRLLVYVPAFDFLWTSLDDKVRHRRRYRRRGLKELVAKANLSVLESGYVDCLGFFAALGFRFFANKNGHLTSHSVKLYDRYLVPASRVLDGLFSRLLGKNVYVVAIKH